MLRGMTERNDILDLRLQILALLQHSQANAACKAIAMLMATAVACRQGDMQPDLAASMLADYCKRDPLI